MRGRSAIGFGRCQNQILKSLGACDKAAGMCAWSAGKARGRPHRAQLRLPWPHSRAISAPTHSNLTENLLVSHTAAARPLSAARALALKGRVRVPGDKSISHRALIFGALATGVTRITGLLEAEDVINTANAVTALGAPAAKTGAIWVVKGRGVGGSRSPMRRSISATRVRGRG